MTTATMTSRPGKRASANGALPHMTERQFVDWCDETTRAEWVDGEVVLMSPVNLQHYLLTFFLSRLLAEFVEQRDAGMVVGEPYQVRFSRLRRRRLPDIFFVSKERTKSVTPQHFDGAPDLIVEVISVDSQNRDRREKFIEYEKAGVREYWIVDPLGKTVDLYALSDARKFEPVEGKTWLRSLVLPGFAVKPSWLWRAKLPKVSACLREMRGAK